MKSGKNQVPIVVVKRLPRYYRYLGELLKQGIMKISSTHLSEKMGVTASQIRQDLNCFGGFGQQGYGYNVEHLYRRIGEILGLDKGYTTILIGAGNLGHALANHANFEKRGFKMIAIFDKSEKLVGKEIHNLIVKNTNEIECFVKNNKVDIAVLALPKEAVKEIADKLVTLGIKGLWNFSYTDIDVPPHIAIENVHLSDSLMTLSYRLAEDERK